MKKYLFEYFVHPSQDHEVFQSMCQRLEAFFPRMIKDGLYRDIDEDETAEYTLDGAGIVVKSDFWVDAVYIMSDVELPKDLMSVSNPSSK